MILIVYSDPIVTYRNRYKRSCNFGTYAIAECQNWHRPYKLSRRIKSLDDFITTKIAVDDTPITRFLDSCMLLRPVRIVFVLPAGFLAEPQYQWAKAIVVRSLASYPELADCQMSVSRFGSPQVVAETTHFITSGRTIASDTNNLCEAQALHDIEHQYLSWRMSGTLSSVTKSRVGIDPTQLEMLHNIAIDTAGHELKPNLKLKIHWDSEVFEVNNALGFSDRILQLKNETYKQESRELVSSPKFTDSVVTGTFQLIAPSLSVDTVNLEFTKAFVSRAYDRLMLLCSVGVIENPYEHTNIVHDTNSQVFSANRFGSSALTEDPHVEIQLEYPIASLLEFSDKKLVDVLTDLWNRQICWTAIKQLTGSIHIVRVGKFQFYVPITSDASASYMHIQKYHQAVTSSNFLTNLEVQMDTKLLGWEQHLFTGDSLRESSRALGRLIEKYYVVNNDALFLSEFGATVYVIAYNIYHQFLISWKLLDSIGLGNADPVQYINTEFDKFRATCDQQLSEDENSGLPKAYVNEKPWTLVIKTLKTCKQAYWKQGQNKHGIDLTFKLADGKAIPSLAVAPNLSYAKQDELGLVKFVLCDKCSAIVAHRVFSEVYNTSHFVCPNCRNRSAFYVTPTVEKES